MSVRLRAYFDFCLMTTNMQIRYKLAEVRVRTMTRKQLRRSHVTSQI